MTPVDTIYDDMLAFLVKIARINSGSSNLEGIVQVISLCGPMLRQQGFAVEMLEGRHLVARRGGSLGPRVLILGHMDTVYEKGHPFSDVAFHGNILNGPGVGDMKGGIAVALYGLYCLNAMGALDNRAVTVLLNSDEEIGSVSSRRYIEEEARHHDLVLVFEGGKRFEERTTFVIERQGVGKAQFNITGVSSHAGMNHQMGVNALEEMSHKILHLQRLTDYDRGTTVSVGGTVDVKDPRKNVIPGQVSFHVDFRYRSVEEAERLRGEFSRIAATSYVVNSRTGCRASTEFDFSISRPPMIPTQECLEHASTLQRLGDEIEHPMVPRTRPGTSDGCFTSGLGVTTLDGLGPVGSEWHTVNEYVELPSLRKRTELFIRFWETL